MKLCNVCGWRPAREGASDCLHCREAWERAQASAGFVPTVELFEVSPAAVEAAAAWRAHVAKWTPPPVVDSWPLQQLDMFRSTQETLNLQRPDHE